MKLSINIDFDSTSPNDLKKLRAIVDLLSPQPGHPSTIEREEFEYEEAWRECSWEIVAFAIALIYVNDGGSSEKGIYAFFDTLCGETAAKICGQLTERSISSRVGRTSVICKKFGSLRLMSVGTRKTDKAKRVYINEDAARALLQMLKGDWGKEFSEYMTENSYHLPPLNSLELPLAS
jgi:hypothetical protein